MYGSQQIGVARAEGLMGGGGPPLAGPCITADQRAEIQAAITAYEVLRGKAPELRGAVAPRKFPFYPLGGTLYRDLFTSNFNDLDPTSGILDWDCTDFTYDGHDATDTGVRTFGEQAIGVPIFAVLDGTVIHTHDGEDDMHTSCSGDPIVIIDHGAGHFCYYLHMRKNSLAVAVGQPVHAGQQIGLIGSSGCSTGPHLHFSTYDSFGTVQMEPYQGACQPNASQWINQTPIYRPMYLQEFNITNALIENYPGLPVDMPRTGTFVSGVQGVSFWINLPGQPANSTWRVRYRRPNGTIAFDSGTGSFNNPFLRWSWWWWRYNINLNTIGTWNILLDINGSTIITAPFTVVAAAGQIVNRPPNAIAAAFDTSHPRIEDAIFCRVQTSLTLDDPDYDIVRYHYVWRVNSVEVRNVTTAGYADAIPRFGVCSGDLVECEVTPMDAIASGPTVLASITVAPVAPVPGDLSSNGVVGTEDISQFVSVLLGISSVCEDRITSDISSDAKVDGADIAPFIQLILNP
jgi:murein DD-endopeptidase MepM/ murein hydrolase activator NlpD